MFCEPRSADVGVGVALSLILIDNNMANLCESLIAKDIDVACDDMVSKGLESDGLIINRADIDFTKSVIENNVISSIVLKSGKKAYAIKQTGNTPFTGTKSTLVVGTYRNTWTHDVQIVVLANTPDVTADIIDGLANGKFVVILRNVTKGEDGKAEYQVFGYAQGLTCSAGENDKYSEDTEGGWLITLEETSAPKSALFFYDTSSTQTAAKYESLKTNAE